MKTRSTIVAECHHRGQGAQPYRRARRAIGGRPPQQLAALIRDELPRWSRVVKEAGIRLD